MMAMFVWFCGESIFPSYEAGPAGANELANHPRALRNRT